MTDPVLHIIAGPNGAGKTTFYSKVVGPVTHLDFVNADIIAADRWPETAAQHSYEAAQIAAAERDRLIQARESFVTETVFSHESKIALLRDAKAAGFRVTLHIVLIPEDLAVARVTNRVTHGGHQVPKDKVRSRFFRLWGHLHDAVELVDEARVYDNTSATDPFRLVASYINGHRTGDPKWPEWTPQILQEAGR